MSMLAGHCVCFSAVILTRTNLIFFSYLIFCFAPVEKKINDDDIMELSSTLSLKCPVSRISFLAIIELHRTILLCLKFANMFGHCLKINSWECSG